MSDARSNQGGKFSFLVDEPDEALYADEDDATDPGQPSGNGVTDV